MKDRIVQWPHRYQLVPVSGQADTYDIVAKPGTVTEAGTPINKANLLSDETAELYGLSANEANVDIVLRRGFGLSSYAAFCANANTDSLDSAFGKNNESEVFGIGRQLAMYSWFKGTDKTSSPFTNLMKQNTFAECLSNVSAFTEILMDVYIVSLIEASPYAVALYDVALYDDATIGKAIAYLAGLNPDDFADMTAVANSETAMTAVAASETAMTAVIANSTAMTAVVASSTAMTAVAASETAMIAVIASSTAMTAIFESETAMTAVAASSTACTAIRNSATAITALDNSSPITVPEMTSNTTPSGKASASSIANTGVDAWKAFNKSNISMAEAWISASGSITNQWIEYEFTSPVWVYRLSYEGRLSYLNQTFKDSKLQYYNGSTWVDAYSFQPQQTSGPQKFTVASGTGKHTRWRVFASNVWGGDMTACGELGLYGK